MSGGSRRANQPSTARTSSPGPPESFLGVVIVNTFRDSVGAVRVERVDVSSLSTPTAARLQILKCAGVGQRRVLGGRSPQAALK